MPWSTRPSTPPARQTGPRETCCPASRGAYQNRTGVNGFAGRCVTTPPRRRMGPAAKRPRKRLKGFEPSTFCMASRRSSQLSYSREVGAVYPEDRSRTSRPSTRRGRTCESRLTGGNTDLPCRRWSGYRGQSVWGCSTCIADCHPPGYRGPSSLASCPGC